MLFIVMILKRSNYRFVYSLFILIILSVSCNNGQRKVVQELEDLSTQQVCLPVDSLFGDSIDRILVLVEDTGECSACSLHVNEWYVYRLDMEDRSLQGHIIYVLKERNRLNQSVDSMITEYGLYCFYGYDELIELNPFLKDVPYRTFLIDSNGKILLSGSPVEIPKLWSLYRKALGRKE